MQRAPKPVGDVWISAFSTFLPKFWLLWAKILGEIIPARPPSCLLMFLRCMFRYNKHKKLFLSCILLLAVK